MHALEMHALEMHALEMHALEMHALEMHALEILYALEMHALITLHTLEMHALEMYALNILQPFKMLYALEIGPLSRLCATQELHEFHHLLCRCTHGMPKEWGMMLRLGLRVLVGKCGFVQVSPQAGCHLKLTPMIVLCDVEMCDMG